MTAITDPTLLNVQAEADADRDLASVLSTGAGRRFIWRVIEMFGSETDVFSADPYEHAYNAGQQAVGHIFIDLIKDTHFDHFQMMEREAHVAQEDVDK